MWKGKTDVHYIICLVLSISLKKISINDLKNLKNSNIISVFLVG